MQENIIWDRLGWFGSGLGWFGSPQTPQNPQKRPKMTKNDQFREFSWKFPRIFWISWNSGMQANIIWDRLGWFGSGLGWFGSPQTLQNPQK